jgi:hypothetical protein
MAERGDSVSDGKESGWNLPPHSDVAEKTQQARFGSQTLIRGLDVLEAVSSGVSNPADLVNVLGLNRSTVYRIAAALVQRRYLSFVPRYGYGLGPKALEIGYQARAQLPPGAAQRRIDIVAQLFDRDRRHRPRRGPRGIVSLTGLGKSGAQGDGAKREKQEGRYVWFQASHPRYSRSPREPVFRPRRSSPLQSSTGWDAPIRSRAAGLIRSLAE